MDRGAVVNPDEQNDDVRAICGLCTDMRERLAPFDTRQGSPLEAIGLSSDDFSRLLDAP
ncbi:MAG: hypothetical protein AAGC83_12040 [Pseudomonadota bacterium]